MTTRARLISIETAREYVFFRACGFRAMTRGRRMIRAARALMPATTLTTARVDTRADARARLPR